MAQGYNHCTFVGNLGQDPELRNTGSGTAVCTLRLAVGDRRKDRDGNWQDVTEWVTIVAFGRTAENVQRFCRKGSKLLVEGKMQTRKWQDRDGQDRWTTEILANRVMFLDSKADGGGSYGGGGRSSSAQGGGSYDQTGDDEIPF